MAFIEVKDLSKKYGDSVEALRGVAFSVEKGEWIAVMGPSGSGKSTLLNILGCLDSPTSGRVSVDGCELSSLRSSELARFRAEKVGFIFQQFHLVPYLTAVENVMLAQYFHSVADEQEAAEALRSRRSGRSTAASSFSTLGRRTAARLRVAGADQPTQPDPGR